jgi:hypothetical protein
MQPPLNHGGRPAEYSGFLTVKQNHNQTGLYLIPPDGNAIALEDRGWDSQTKLASEIRSLIDKQCTVSGTHYPTANKMVFDKIIPSPITYKHV